MEPSLVTQSQSKTPITRSVHCKFNQFTLALQRTGKIILQTIEIETFMMLHKYSQNRIFNLAVLVLPKLYSGYFRQSNLPNTLTTCSVIHIQTVLHPFPCLWQSSYPQIIDKSKVKVDVTFYFDAFRGIKMVEHSNKKQGVYLRFL